MKVFLVFIFALVVPIIASIAGIDFRGLFLYYLGFMGGLAIGSS